MAATVASPMPAPAAAINPPPHTPWAVPPAAVASFAAHGVAVLPGFAPPDAVDVLRAV